MLRKQKGRGRKRKITDLTSKVCKIVAAQAWRCCCLIRGWVCSKNSRTGFSTLLTNGDDLLGACREST